MKITRLISTVASSIILTACIAANATSNAVKESSYKINVFKDCELVKSVSMTASQVTAYKNLQATELEIKALEIPLQNMEQEIAPLTKRLDALSELIVEESSEKMSFNKNLFRKQQTLADEIEQIVQMYEKDIKKLERKARNIEKVAREFEREVTTDLEDTEHDFIRIVTPDKDYEDLSCNNRNRLYSIVHAE